MEAPRKADESRVRLSFIKHKYLIGDITREEAELLAAPVIEYINQNIAYRTKVLNKKYGMHRKPFTVTFRDAMRMVIY